MQHLYFKPGDVRLTNASPCETQHRVSKDRCYGHSATAWPRQFMLRLKHFALSSGHGLTAVEAPSSLLVQICHEKAETQPLP